MLSFEVVRDFSYFYPPDPSVMTVLSTVTEEDISEREHEASKGGVELDIDFEEILTAQFISANIVVEIFEAHDLLYIILEQKIILPPPEHSVS